jgi:hypothetical protein
MCLRGVGLLSRIKDPTRGGRRLSSTKARKQSQEPWEAEASASENVRGGARASCPVPGDEVQLGPVPSVTELPSDSQISQSQAEISPICEPLPKFSISQVIEEAKVPVPLADQRVR